MSIHFILVIIYCFLIKHPVSAFPFSFLTMLVTSEYHQLEPATCADWEEADPVHGGKQRPGGAVWPIYPRKQYTRRSGMI